MTSRSPSPSGARSVIRCVVEERAVAALQVFDEIVAALAKNRGVTTAHGGHVERHLAIGAAADDGSIAIELKTSARGMNL